MAHQRLPTKDDMEDTISGTVDFEMGGPDHADDD